MRGPCLPALLSSCLLLAACESVDPLGASSFTIEANPHNRFSAVVGVEVDRDVTAWVEAGVDGAYDNVTPPVDVAAGEHAEILLLGLEADRTFDVRVVVDDGAEGWASEPQTWVTDPLPDGFPQVDTRTKGDADLLPDGDACSTWWAGWTPPTSPR